MPFRYQVESETEQIGKMIAAGHPKLAERMYLARLRYRLATKMLAALVALLGTGSLLWHWFR